MYVTGTGYATATKSESRVGDELSQEAFFDLLMAQLLNQDPMNPMESAEFTSQLAQLNLVSEVMNIRDLLESNLGQAEGVDPREALGYIGREVMVNGGEFAITPTSSSTEQLYFSLGADASRVELEILDESDNVVRTIQLNSLPAGPHELMFDCKNDAGTELLTGQYRVVPKAYNDSGEEIFAENGFRGVVSEVRFENGQAYLVVSGKTIAVDDVDSIR